MLARPLYDEITRHTAYLGLVRLRQTLYTRAKQGLLQVPEVTALARVHYWETFGFTDLPDYLRSELNLDERSVEQVLTEIEGSE